MNGTRGYMVRDGASRLLTLRSANEIGAPMQNATDDIVSSIMKRWGAAFTRLDAAALAALYSKNAFFFGSNPALYRGNDGVKAYFEGLPRWQSPSVEFTEVRSAQAASDLINVAGTATFTIEKDAEPLVVKITWVILREGGDWKIVSHHVSSMTPLIRQ
jgi:ketosteroid isomerase-like protein